MIGYFIELLNVASLNTDRMLWVLFGVIFATRFLEDAEDSTLITENPTKREVTDTLEAE